MRINPWRKSVRFTEERRAAMAIRVDPAWSQAIREVTAHENTLYPGLISLSTVVQDLSSRNGSYFTELRKKVNDRYKQLKREKHDEQNSTSYRRDLDP